MIKDLGIAVRVEGGAGAELEARIQVDEDVIALTSSSQTQGLSF
ncbi:MAG: hypothetical protein VB949_13615 [Pseudomonadales bacterium]